MAKGIKRKIKRAIRNTEKEISDFAKDKGRVAAGLAAEGYNGGYRDALFDVSLLLDGNLPCVNRRVWRKPERK